MAEVATLNALSGSVRGHALQFRELIVRQQHDQPLAFVHLDDAIEEPAVHAMDDRRSFLDVLFLDVHDLADGVHDQAGGRSIQLDDHDPAVFLVIIGRHAEPRAGIDDGQDVAAEIGDAFDVARCLGHRGDLGQSHDFLDGADVKAELDVIHHAGDEFLLIRVVHLGGLCRIACIF